MKKCIGFILAITLSAQLTAQDLNDLFTAGLNDAELFVNDYLAPLSEASVYSISNGWYNTADAKPLGGFEISVVGNITGFKNATDKQSFILNPLDYENLDFVDNPGQARPVATALGTIEGIRVFVEDETGLLREEFELPAGLFGDNFNFLPTGFLQASVGLVNGLEVKARFIPKISGEEYSAGLLGAGLQYEFTKLLPADKIWPIALSAVVGYTSLNGEYDFTETGFIQGNNQRIDATIDSWNFSAVVSTRKIPVINFYGALGYITGTSQIDFLGEYTVSSGPFAETYVDPFSVTRDVSGVVANIGTKIKLGFFRINVDYTLGEFNTVTAALNFGFR